MQSSTKTGLVAGIVLGAVGIGAYLLKRRLGKNGKRKEEAKVRLKLDEWLDSDTPWKMTTTEDWINFHQLLEADPCMATALLSAHVIDDAEKKDQAIMMIDQTNSWVKDMHTGKMVSYNIRLTPPINGPIGMKMDYRRAYRLSRMISVPHKNIGGVTRYGFGVAPDYFTDKTTVYRDQHGLYIIGYQARYWIKYTRTCLLLKNLRKDSDENRVKITHPTVRKAGTYCSTITSLNPEPHQAGLYFRLDTVNANRTISGRPFHPEYMVQVYLLDIVPTDECDVYRCVRYFLL